MLMLPSNTKVYLARAAVDMRSSFDGLSAIVQNTIEENPFSGHLFVFSNKGRNKVKILYWDRNGFCIWYKRFEKGRYVLPELTGDSIELSLSDLHCLLEGIDLKDIHRLPTLHYQKVA